MATSSPWPLIHAEREALAGDLAPLTNEQWATPSLCTGWTVRDVLGHMTSTAKMTPAAFFTGFAASGFNFHAFNQKRVTGEATAAPADGLAEFRRHLSSTSHPPGPGETWLAETVIHAEDIRRPLGIKRDYPAEALARVADFTKRTNTLLGAKRRIAGLHLRATDADWSTGSGPEVSGPLLSLILAMTGRTAALDDLAGDGLPTLRSRG